MKKHQITALVVGSSFAVAAGVFAGTAFAGPDCDKGAAAQHMPGGRLAQMDGDKDGKVSLAEFSAAREGWLARVDANKDGVATQAEIDAGFAAGRKEHAQKRFTREDVDKDGKLARTETRMPAAMFERADTNHDGFLTLAEATDARQRAHDGAKAGKAGKPHAEGKGGPGGKLRRHDSNGDGRVDLQEVKNAAAESFARLDTNKDGSLTPDEMPAHGRGHGRRHGHGHEGAGAPAPAAPAAPTRS